MCDVFSAGLEARLYVSQDGRRYSFQTLLRDRSRRNLLESQAEAFLGASVPLWLKCRGRVTTKNAARRGRNQRSADR